MRVDIFTSIKGKLVYIYIYYLGLSLNSEHFTPL